MTRPRGGVGLMDAHRLSPVDDNDFYPTPPWAARAACEHILRLDRAAAHHLWWEPACGAGHFVHGARDYAGDIFASDAYRYGDHALYDFVSDAPPPVEAGWIVTNPPFKHLEAFVRLGWARASRGVALLVRACVMGLAGEAAQSARSMICPPSTSTGSSPPLIRFLMSTISTPARFAALRPRP